MSRGLEEELAKHLDDAFTNMLTEQTPRNAESSLADADTPAVNADSNVELEGKHVT